MAAPFEAEKPSTGGDAHSSQRASTDRERGSGYRRADRDDFGDAVDFIGWYNHQSTRLAGIAPNDPFNLYLAYHEGHGGFRRATYAGKDWLIRAARQVETDARRYDGQIERCEGRLDRNWIPFL